MTTSTTTSVARSGGMAVRPVLGLTALTAAIGTAAELWASYHRESPIYDGAGFTTTFGPGWDGLWNQLFFFTTFSNVIVGVTCLMLALQPVRRSDAFHAWRVAGLVNIVITGVVFHLLLAGGAPNTGLAAFASTLQHTVNPILAVGGWLLVGPRGSFTRRRLLLSLCVPIAWVVVALVRGAVVDWYPYDFIDVSSLGYLRALANTGGVLVFWLVVAAVLFASDRFLLRRTATGAQGGADPRSI